MARARRSRASCSPSTRCSSRTRRSIRSRAGATRASRRSPSSRAGWPRYVTALRHRGQRARLRALRLPRAWRRCSPGCAAARRSPSATARGARAVARAGGAAELPAGAHRLEPRRAVQRRPARRSARRWRRRSLARAGRAVRLRERPVPARARTSTSAWCCSRCGCSSSSIRRRCCSAPATCATAARAAPRRAATRPEFFIRIEAFIAAANLVGGRRCCSRRWSRRGRPARAHARRRWSRAALAVKAAAFAIMMRREDVSPGSRRARRPGSPPAWSLALAALALPRTARLVLAAVLVMAATVLVNLAPPNPYLAATLQGLAAGHTSSTSTA